MRVITGFGESGLIGMYFVHKEDIWQLWDMKVE